MASGRARFAAVTAVRPTGTRLDRQQRHLAIGLVLGVMMVAFEITAVLTALPSITDELHGDSLYGVALASYTLANLVALVVTGEFTDRYGPAKPYLASLVVLAAGLVVAATASSMAIVVLGRTMQGAGTGGLAPIAYVLVKRAFPADRQANMYAFLAAGWVLPSLLAPAIAGTITDQIGWRWVFWLLLPLIPVVAFITIPPMRMYAATGSGVIRHSRIAAAVLAAAGIGIFVTSLQFANPIALLGGAAAGLAMALPTLQRLLPAGLSHVARGLPASVLCRILATAAFLGADSFIPLAADRIHGASPTIQGFVIIGASLSWTGGSWFVAHRPALDPRRTVQAGFAILTLGLAASVPVIAEGWPLWATFFAWSIGGFGMGLLFNPTTVVAMSYADEGAEGLVSSQVNLADSVGFSTMGGIGGAMVALSGRTALTLPGALAINFTLAIGLGCCGVLCARRIAAR
ncbi:MAG TPA: MFS transporter [Ilumatobacteraceae bacterium]|nr:MFS transporter [Ilumatobacteraceae bacterium]